MLRLIIAIIFPWFLFFTIGRPFSAILCIILQISLIGWIPAAIWAVFMLNQYNTKKAINNALNKN